MLVINLEENFRATQYKCNKIFRFRDREKKTNLALIALSNPIKVNTIGKLIAVKLTAGNSTSAAHLLSSEITLQENNTMGQQLPNIILIIMDSARSDCFGCYGSTENLTPNIDSLARGSVICDHFYAAGPSSALSHVAIFSSTQATTTEAGTRKRSQILCLKYSQ